MTDLKPKDMIAIIVLLCFTFLVFNGVNTPLTEFLAVFAGYYFGHRKAGIDSGH